MMNIEIKNYQLTWAFIAIVSILTLAFSSEHHQIQFNYWESKLSMAAALREVCSK